jgi:hypothetical protein
MSYDLMVFDQSRAPKDKQEFLQWFQEVTSWAEDFDYNDPSHAVLIN